MSLGLFIRVSSKENEHTPPFFVLSEPNVTLGRHGDIRMDTAHGKEISKVHCTFTRRTRGTCSHWILTDNDSLNGTFVNNRRIHRVVLGHGDEVVFGGGSEFKVGDVIESSENAQCRYLFFVLPLPIKFAEAINPNSTTKLEEGATCVICYDSVVNPNKIPCGHVFCGDCLRRWAKKSEESGMCPVCPLCRSGFGPRDLVPREAKVTNQGLVITDVEPFLRRLNIDGCGKVRKFHILKKWREEHKTAFWGAYEKVKDNRIRVALFLHLVKATFRYVSNATDDELVEAMKNLECEERPDEREERVAQIMLAIMKKLAPKPSHMQYLPAKIRVRSI